LNQTALTDAFAAERAGVLVNDRTNALQSEAVMWKLQQAGEPALAFLDRLHGKNGRCEGDRGLSSGLKREARWLVAPQGQALRPFK
jgi:hypothetical protein